MTCLHRNMSSAYNAELNRRVEQRINEVHDLIIAHQLRAEKDSPDDPVVKKARAFIKTNFGPILPAPVERSSFLPPQLTPANPFEQITFDDLSDDDDDDDMPAAVDPEVRITEINKLLNRPGLNNQERHDLIKEARNLRAQITE